MVYRLKCIERDHSFTIIPIWTPRLHPRLVLADTGSRLHTSTDEWSIDRHALAALFAATAFLPDVDGFAVSANAICPTFFSPVPQVAAAGVDFFAHVPDPALRYFLCPPVSLISRLFRHLLANRPFPFLLITPHWPSTTMWALLHPAGSPHPIFTGHFSFQPAVFSAFGSESIFTSGSVIFDVFIRH